MVDQPGADLDTAAAAALKHLDQTRELLAPFFIQDYVLGDVVDIVERTGQEHIQLAGVTVVEIHGDGSAARAVVQDTDGDRHLVTGSTVHKRNDSN